MKLERAEFILMAPNGRTTVVFEGDTVHVLPGDIDKVAMAEGFKLNNAPMKWGGRPYKPCVSHAMKAVRHALGEHAKNLSEERQQSHARPKPKLVRYER